jgi:uncharacterized protein YqeY
LENEKLNWYLSQQLPTDDKNVNKIDVISEVEKIVKEILIELGANSMSDMGRVMGKVISQLNGKADGKLISNVVKNLLR